MQDDDKLNDAAAVVLIGFGGHASVVRDVLQVCGVAVAGYIDRVQYDTDVPYLGTDMTHLADTGSAAHSYHVAIGNNAVRGDKFRQLEAAGLALTTVIHPSATIAASVSVGAGTFVGARAVLNPGARLGAGVLVNTGAIVEHDCTVGAYSHMAPGAVLCGAVQVGEGVLVGANATVLPGVQIGAGARVGAGAVVKNDLADGATQA